jgi:CheY-like chemotaxis protein
MSERLIEILLVEDNAGEARLTVEALKEAGAPAHLSHVSDGAAALEFLRREGRFAGAPRPQLILLDLNLPAVDGRAVLKAIKAHEDWRRIPVVVLTNSQSEEDVTRAYDLCANCYVPKPLDLDAFLRTVRVLKEFWLTIAKLPAA